MRAVDTNVLVRLVTGDTAEQVSAAERFVEAGAWVPLAAMLECAWVLRSVYRYTEEEVVTTVGMLLENDRMQCQEGEAIRAALASCRETPKIQFADALILESARRAGHLPLGTFDKKLATRKNAVRI